MRFGIAHMARSSFVVAYFFTRIGVQARQSQIPILRSRTVMTVDAIGRRSAMTQHNFFIPDSRLWPIEHFSLCAGLRKRRTKRIKRIKAHCGPLLIEAPRGVR